MWVGENSVLDNSWHVLESSAQSGRRLRCSFGQAGDRFTHKIEVSDGDQSTLVLCSVEDDSASGPLQELHVHEQTDGSSALMLVGKAGKNHWSLCVTADAESNSLIFDAACRVREPVPFLGAVYDRQVTSLVIQVEPIDIPGAESSAIHADENRLIIEAECAAEYPATIRWMYRISLSE